MRVYVGLLLAIEGLGLLMHGIEGALMESLMAVIPLQSLLSVFCSHCMAASAPAARMASRPLATLVAYAVMTGGTCGCLANHGGRLGCSVSLLYFSSLQS